MSAGRVDGIAVGRSIRRHAGSGGVTLLVGAWQRTSVAGAMPCQTTDRGRAAARRPDQTVLRMATPQPRKRRSRTRSR